MSGIDPILDLLQKDARLTIIDIADRLQLDEQTVRQRLRQWETDGTILGYQAVLDPDRAGDKNVVALIEVKISPEREGGFDRLAHRIARFDQVRSCHLISGAYDLAVTVEGQDLRDVAQFVSEKLSTMHGVLSTATHFRLKTYKENGLLVDDQPGDERLPVTP